MSPEPTPPAEVSWTPEALQRLKRAPMFLRGMVKKLAEKKAREDGIGEITSDFMGRLKGRMMNQMGGKEAFSEAADEIEKGGIVWTREARDRLETVPEFMRDMTRRIAEEVAREGGHLEVNRSLLDKVEALGEEKEPEADEMPWTTGALAELKRRIEKTPEMAMDFVLTMLKQDVEDAARKKGIGSIDEDALQRLRDEPKEEVTWAPEAWARLMTSPDFVRSGIKKAAERRARRLGAKTITSDLLTTFRNAAMMKAVKRIRRFGYTELTFDAFEDALGKVKRLKDNPEAKKRLEDIRAYMAKHGPTGNLGAELMERFRKYLKGEGDLPEA